MKKRTVAFITVIGGFVIFGLKLIAFTISGSIALLSDALESIVNIVASILMFFSVKMSGKPADSNHTYGHEKIENISAFIEGVLVVIAALLIVYTAIGRLRNPTFELLELNIAVGISFLALVRYTARLLTQAAVKISLAASAAAVMTIGWVEPLRRAEA